MLAVEQDPVEARAGDHLDAVVRGQARPQADLGASRFERSLEGIFGKIHSELHTRLLHHLRPLRLLGGEPAAEALGVPARTSVPSLARRSFISAVLSTRTSSAFSFATMSLRNAGGADDALERSGLEAGQALLGDGRRVGRRGEALRAGDREGAQPAARDRWPGGEHAVEEHLGLRADDPSDRVRAALVGDVGPLHAGALRELDAGELRRAADAGDGEVELAGIAPSPVRSAL